MVAEESEDLWLAYNLISEGDSVLAVTVRYLSMYCVVMYIHNLTVKS